MTKTLRIEKRGGHLMISQEKTTLIHSKWDIVFTFRLALQKYLKSIDHVHNPKQYTDCHQDKKLSLSENIGYSSSRILQMCPVVSDDCGKETEVPFITRQSRPVYRNDCHDKIKPGRKNDI